MSKAELGIKRLCASCGAKFYDLFKDPITCPKCASVFEPMVVAAPRSRRAVEPLPVVAAAADLEGESSEAAVAADEDEDSEADADDKVDGAVLLVVDDEDDAGNVGIIDVDPNEKD